MNPLRTAKISLSPSTDKLSMNTGNILKRILLGALCAMYLTGNAHAAAPAVNLIRPTNGSSYAVGSTILVRALATASNATLASLDFVAGTNVIRHFPGPLTNGTFNFSWTNAPVGIHQVHAEALDDAGAQGVSATAQIAVTNVPVSIVPIVTLIQPTNNAVFVTGTSIILTASATDSDGTISFVEFFSNTNSLGQVNGLSTNGLYQLAWTNAPVGMFQLRAEAVDNAGSRGVSASVQVSVSGVVNLAPVISWVYPTNGVSLPGNPILLTAQATDPDGVASYVDFYATPTNQPSVTAYLGRILGPHTNSLYSILWSNATPGSFHLQAVAGDNLGLRGYSQIIEVMVGGGTNPPPTNCTFALSHSNATHSAVLGTGAVSVVTQTNCGWEVYSSNSWIHVLPPSLHIGSDPVVYFVDANLGTTRTGLVRIDGQNFGVTQSGAGTNSPPTNAWPVVSWFLPTNGSSFAAGSSILLRAIASDSDGTLGIVDFLAGTNLLGRVPATTNGTYSFMWSNAPAGTFQLHAEAVDNIGERGASASVQIVVGGGTNPPPTNCTFALSHSNATHSAVLGTGAVSVVTQTNCGWEVYSSNSWIHVLPPSLHIGSDPVVYFVDANLGTTRTGLVRIDGQNFGVTQSGAGTNSPPTNAWPVVSWFLPTNGSSFAAGSSILLRAIASDSDGTLGIVDFLAGTNLLGRVPATTNGTYSFMWSNAPAGTFQLHAEAVDNIGERGASASVQIVVGGGGGGMVDVGIVPVSTIGYPNPSLFPSNGVVNYLIDQDQSSGGGGVLPGLPVNWDTNSHFKLTVAAPTGMKFAVNVPPGRVARFGGFLWWESSRGGFSGAGGVSATFTDVEGIAPTFYQSDSALSDSHGFFGFSDLESSGITNSFSFTSITLTGTVTPQYTGNGTENYVPHLESSLQIHYSTTQTNDPGSFVSIIPAGPHPMIRMLSASPVSGVVLLVSGRPGVTHVVECSTDTVTWIPISSRVMPPMGSMIVSDGSAPALDSRFYRVVEIP